MRCASWLLGATMIVGACGSSGTGTLPLPTRDRAVVVAEADGTGSSAGARSVRVPPGHYPKRGQCRVWYEGRPPGQQPRPGRCEDLVGRVPRGAFLLYNDRAWDTEHDWRRESARNPSSVPDAVLRIMNSLVRA